MQQIANLTLQKAMDMCRDKEATTEQIKSFATAPTNEISYSYITSMSRISSLLIHETEGEAQG